MKKQGARAVPGWRCTRAGHGVAYSPRLGLQPLRSEHLVCLCSFGGWRCRRYAPIQCSYSSRSSSHAGTLLADPAHAFRRERCRTRLRICVPHDVWKKRTVLGIDAAPEAGAPAAPCIRGLTFELSGRRRQAGRPDGWRINQPSRRACQPAGGGPLERGVRRRRAMSDRSHGCRCYDRDASGAFDGVAAVRPR